MPRIDEFAKDYLHGDLRWIREALVWNWDAYHATIERAARAADPTRV